MEFGMTVRSRLGAIAVSLYALVVLLLLPMHLLEREAGPREGRAGDAVTASCQDRDCHVPSHRHEPQGHSHDAATCVKCAQTAPAASAVPFSAVVLPSCDAIRPASAATADAVRSLLRAAPGARGPPVLS